MNDGQTRRGRRTRRLIEVIRKHNIKFVATDLDGTCYSFWDYFVPAMQRAVPYIAEVMGLGKADYDRISQDIGRVMGIYGTHEHPWSLEETWLRKEFKGTAVEFRNTIVRPFWEALDRYRGKYLRPYADVRETLQSLWQAGIPVVAVSDAPAHMAIVRITQTGLDELISGLYALETIEPAVEAGLSAEDLEYGRDRVREFGHTHHRLQVFKTMPKNHEKPAPLGLKMAMSEFGITDPTQVLMIGDSLIKDGGVAEAVGCHFIWARYGTLLPAGYRELIDVKFAPSSAAPTGHTPGHRPKTLPPMVAQAASYADMLRYLNLEGLDRARTMLPGSAMPNATRSSQH